MNRISPPFVGDTPMKKGRASHVCVRKSREVGCCQRGGVVPVHVKSSIAGLEMDERGCRSQEAASF